MAEINGREDEDRPPLASIEAKAVNEALTMARLDMAEAITRLIIRKYQEKGLPCHEVALYVDVQHVMAHIRTQLLPSPVDDETRHAIARGWVNCIVDARLAREIEWECHLHQLSRWRRTLAPATPHWDATIPPIQKSGERTSAKWLRGQPKERKQDASIAGVQGILDGLRAFGQPKGTSCRCRSDGALDSYVFTSMMNEMRDELGFRTQGPKDEQTGSSEPAAGAPQDLAIPSDPSGHVQPKPFTPSRREYILPSDLVPAERADLHPETYGESPEDEIIRRQFEEDVRRFLQALLAESVASARWGETQQVILDVIGKRHKARSDKAAARKQRAPNGDLAPSKPPKDKPPKENKTNTIYSQTSRWRNVQAQSWMRQHPEHAEQFDSLRRRVEQMIRPFTPEVRKHLARKLWKLRKCSPLDARIIKQWIDSTDAYRKLNPSGLAKQLGIGLSKVDQVLTDIRLELKEEFRERWEHPLLAAPRKRNQQSAKKGRPPMLQA